MDDHKIRKEILLETEIAVLSYDHIGCGFFCDYRDGARCFLFKDSLEFTCEKDSKWKYLRHEKCLEIFGL